MTTQSPLLQASDDRLSNMLFEGERIEEEVVLNEARIAVTSHRVLVFIPDGDGPRFDHADRPNVTDASVETAGERTYVGWSVRSAVYGAVLLGGGYLLRSSGAPNALSGADVTGNPGIGGVAQLVGVLSAGFEVLVQLLLLSGSVLLLVAAVFGAGYLTTRNRELVIERAGRDAIRVPVETMDGDEVARQIRTAVGTGSNRHDE